jgi:hypothetical protein
VFSNKVLYFLRIFRENYLEAFSPQFLFLYGETGGLAPLYGTLFRGVMYIIELPLLLVGLYALFHKRLNKLPLALLLAAPLSSTFTTDRTYVSRAVMMLPYLAIITAVGLQYFIESLNRYSKVVQRILLIFFSVWYIYIIAGYLYQYYFRYSIYGAEAWQTSSHDLIQYISKKSQSGKTVYIADPGPMFLLQYAIIHNTDPRSVQQAWKNYPDTSLDGIHFIAACTRVPITGDPNILLSPEMVYIVRDSCYPDATPSAEIKERGSIRTIWKIYEKKQQSSNRLDNK